MGYTEVRPQEVTIVKSFLLGRDVFVSLQTGSDKSFCYCCLPVVFDNLTGVRNTPNQSVLAVVVSPLTALMKDQVRTMEAKNMRSV